MKLITAILSLGICAFCTGCPGFSHGVAVGYNGATFSYTITPTGKSPVRAAPSSWVETTEEKIARIKARDDAKTSIPK